MRLLSFVFCSWSSWSGCLAGAGCQFVVFIGAAGVLLLFVHVCGIGTAAVLRPLIVFVALVGLLGWCRLSVHGGIRQRCCCCSSVFINIDAAAILLLLMVFVELVVGLLGWCWSSFRGDICWCWWAHSCWCCCHPSSICGLRGIGSGVGLFVVLKAVQQVTHMDQ